MYTINLVADDGSIDTCTGQGDQGKGVEKVRVETKMGSTGIREWISRQRETGEVENGVSGNEGGAGKERLES